MISLEPGDLERFRMIVLERLGLKFEDREMERLEDVLVKRSTETGHRSAGAYLQAWETADGNREEQRWLAHALTVPETYFFRHPDQFAAFAEVALPGVASRHTDGRPVRILSAGCAGGEEAYTLAILVRERLGDPTWREVEILGIDINAQLLGKAREGRYSEWSLRATPEHRRRQSFWREGRVYVLNDAIRSMVRFEERNLVEEDVAFWSPGRFDIAFCRNVMIYFPAQTVRAVIERISRALAPGGYLFLGPSETLRGVSHDFHLCHTHDAFYYRKRQPGEQEAEAGARPAASETAAEQPWMDVIGRAAQRVATLTEDRQGDAEEKSVVAKGEWDLGRAKELLAQERFHDAAAALGALPAEAQRDPDAMLLRAAVLAHAGKMEEAERVCEQVLREDELNAGAHYVTALCREHSGDREAAARHDQTAVYLDPTFAMPRLHLGLLEKRAGNRDAAMRELSGALELLGREDAARILLFGGGFSRETLVQLCQAELERLRGGS